MDEEQCNKTSCELTGINTSSHVLKDGSKNWYSELDHLYGPQVIDEIMRKQYK